MLFSKLETKCSNDLREREREEKAKAQMTFVLLFIWSNSCFCNDVIVHYCEKVTSTELIIARWMTWKNFLLPLFINEGRLRMMMMIIKLFLSRIVVVVLFIDTCSDKEFFHQNDDDIELSKLGRRRRISADFLFACYFRNDNVGSRDVFHHDLINHVDSLSRFLSDWRLTLSYQNKITVLSSFDSEKFIYKEIGSISSQYVEQSSDVCSWWCWIFVWHVHWSMFVIANVWTWDLNWFDRISWREIWRRLPSHVHVRSEFENVSEENHKSTMDSRRILKIVEDNSFGESKESFHEEFFPCPNCWIWSLNPGDVFLRNWSIMVDQWREE